ncbi:MAG: restriction endonuclease subunit S, partial [candidate division WOR-3 bacterium]|nr:restriction endonuclease subunit S [candidate division WOR-3 bacterium]
KGIGHKEFKYSKELNCQIPKEWEVVKLIEVANIRQNKDISNLDAIAFIPMDLVSNSNIYVRYQVRKKESISSFTYCEAGDLLLAKITPSLENGKQGIVPNDIPNGVALATTEVFPIACENINNLFLFYILKYPKFRNQIIASMIGTTGRQRASKDSVINLKIPLPSGPEQQKIAE